MKINKLQIICFSPTHNTRKILESIASGIDYNTIEIMDITLPSNAPQPNTKVKADFALIGSPVYAGRIPLLAVQRLQNLQANDIPAAIVAVYGNRHYDDALLELNNLTRNCGFMPLAASAFIAQHSFSTSEFPIAALRPDSHDLDLTRDFGKNIAARLADIDLSNFQPTFKLPGCYPYKKRPDSASFTPETDPALCTRCFKCAYACPAEAISIKNPTITNPDKCILCLACRNVCPTGARKANHPAFYNFAQKLNQNCRIPKEPETFFFT